MGGLAVALASNSAWQRTLQPIQETRTYAGQLEEHAMPAHPSRCPGWSAVTMQVAFDEFDQVGLCSFERADGFAGHGQDGGPFN